MSQLKFEAHELPQLAHTMLMRLHGGTDAESAPTFARVLDGLIHTGIKRFILDLQGLQFVDSTGLGVLVRLADQLAASGGGVVLLNIHPAVKMVFDMLGLFSFFTVLPNQDAAEEHFKKQLDPAG